MFSELYQYLLQYKKLPVPGIGTFLLERQSAVADFPAKLIHAPTYAFRHVADTNETNISFYTKLAGILGCSEKEAVIRFNDFSFDLKKNIANGDQVNWSGVGQMSKSLNGELKFIASAPLIADAPVVAEKVLREKAAHSVRVGEQEKTAEEMTAYFNQPVEKKSYWWLWAAIFVLLSFLFLGWHFSSKGIDAVGLQQKIIPLETAATNYTIMQ